MFIGGMAAVIAPSWQWLHGWQKYEARQAEAEQLALGSDAALSTAVAAPEPVFEDDELEMLEDLEDDELEDLDPLEEEFDEEPVTAGGEEPAGRARRPARAARSWITTALLRPRTCVTAWAA